MSSFIECVQRNKNAAANATNDKLEGYFTWCANAMARMDTAARNGDETFYAAKRLDDLTVPERQALLGRARRERPELVNYMKLTSFMSRREFRGEIAETQVPIIEFSY